MTQIPLTIGALSTKTGVNIETIRYYERVGLVPRPPRSHSGRRMYSQKDAERLNFVRRCRELGFSLIDIRSLLALCAANRPCDADVKALILRHLEDVVQRLADLTRLKASLGALAESCTPGAQEACSILAALGAPCIYEFADDAE